MTHHPADFFRQPWLKKARAAALGFGLGATLAEFQPQDEVRVLFDPAGHPFCLYVGG